MKIWLRTAVVAAALMVAGSASAVTCNPPGGISTTFPFSNPASTSQQITNTGQPAGDTSFSCTVEVTVNADVPAVQLAGNITDLGVVVGDQLVVDVFNNGALLKNDFIITLSQLSTTLLDVMSGTLTLVSSGFFLSPNTGAQLSQQFSLSVVPGPIAGAGIPALFALAGLVWARRRKSAAIATA